MGKRIHYLDIAKGILILLLLVSHYSSARRRLDISNDYFYLFDSWQFIFRAFFMQAFFIISGYCSNFNKPFKPFFKTQFKQLIIPFISFEILSAIFWAARTGGLSFHFILSFIFNDTWTVYWFLNALFFSKIVVWIINRITPNQLYLILITLFLFVSGIIINHYNLGRNIFCIRESLGSCLFVAVGFVLRNRTKLYNMLLNLCIYIYPVILILLFFTGIKIPVFAAGMHVTLSQVPIFFITTLTGTFACLRMCKVLDRNKFLEFWGKKTLIVYCTHFWGLILIIPIIFNWFNPISPYSAIPYYILIYLLEIVFCWLIIKLFSSKYLKWAIGSF